MNKQKKKKVNVSQQQKVQLAQSKNGFRRRLSRICMMLPDGETKLKLLERDFEFLYQIRPQPIRSILIGERDPEDFLNYLREELDYAIKRETVPLYEGGPDVSLHEYHQMVQPLQMYIELHNERHPGFKELFAELMQNHQERSANVLHKIGKRAEIMGLTGSNFMQYFYRVGFHIRSPKEINSPREACVVEIKCENPSWRQVKLGNAKRTAARVGWSFPSKIVWAGIRPSQLGIYNLADDSPLDVYMLQHAIDRLYQRIGGKYRQVMLMDIFISFMDPKAIATGGGNYLVEYRINEEKAGYFAATITDGILLIRTFLFLTHSGTPEGRKLTALTGLKKEDQKYLAFDNLLALANSDILSNEETLRIFREAGCEGLLKVVERVKSTSYWTSSEQTNPIAERMLQYIRTGRETAADLWAGILDEEPHTEENAPE